MKANCLRTHPGLTASDRKTTDDHPPANSLATAFPFSGSDKAIGFATPSPSVAPDGP